MVAKVKENYLLEEYDIQLHKKRPNLRQRDLDVAAYTEEFQKLSLRSRVQEVESIKAARYLNGLRWNIQEQLSLFTLTTLHSCYQMAIKVEEKLKKKEDSNTRGKGRGRDSRGGHRGGFGGRSHEKKGQGDSKVGELSTCILLNQ